MALVLSIGDRKRLSAAGRTEAGLRAPLEAPVIWSVDKLGIIELNAQGPECSLRATGPGDCLVAAHSGSLAATFDISVIAPAATKLVIIAEDVKP